MAIAATNAVVPRDGQEGRAAIVAEAAVLFCKQGYAGTSMRQIAAAAGMRAASIYYHFESKESVLYEVMRQSLGILCEDLEARLASLPPDLSGRERLAAAMRAHLNCILSSDEHIVAYMKIWHHLPPDMKARVRAERRRYGEIWTNLIAEAQATGEIFRGATPYMMTSYIVGSMNRVLEWYRPSMGPLANVIEFVTDRILLGVVP